jgi:hypothetical protein
MNLDFSSHTSVPLEVKDDGVVWVAGSRVTLDTVIGAFNDGATAEEFVQQYPSLSLRILTPFLPTICARVAGTLIWPIISVRGANPAGSRSLFQPCRHP